MNEPVQPQQPQKKGFGPLAWIAIGCVGLILIAVVVLAVGGFFVAKKGAEIVGEIQDNPAKAMAEMAIKMNPDTKFVSSDDESVTFEKDGETITMSFEDIEQGKFTMTTGDGETSSFSLGEGGPSGTAESGDGEETSINIFGGGGDTSNVPEEIIYPDADTVNPMVASKSSDQWSGMLNYTTSRTMDEVVEWQGEQLDDCDVSRTDIAGIRNATFTCGRDNVTLTFMGEDGSLTVTTSYNIAVRDE